MADEQDLDGGTIGREPASGAGATGRRWLRWGSVYVDIEPPTGPNPWTAPGWGEPVVADGAPAPAGPPRSRRPLVLGVAAAVVAALLLVLLVAAFTRNDRRPELAAAPTTTRTRPPAPTTRPTAAPTTPASSAPTTAPARPATTSPVTTSPATTAGARPGGPITVPEGVPPSAPAAPSTTVAPSTTTTAGPTAFLGVTVEESLDGALVVDVLPATGAQAAGLLPGDVITAVDATPVAGVDELGAAITARRPGDSVTVTVLRNGATTTLRATLGTR